MSFKAINTIKPSDFCSSRCLRQAKIKPNTCRIPGWGDFSIKRTGVLVVPLGSKTAVLVLPRVFSLKSPQWKLPRYRLGYRAEKYMTADNALY